MTLSPGTYYIGAIADATSTNTEGNETNNTASTTAITVSSGTDLIVSSISGPSSSVTGSRISVANTVNNNGTGTSATSYVKLYLSSDAVIDPATDTYLTQRSIGALAGDGLSSANTTMSLPATLSPGTYYIGAIADATSTNTESDETNNTASTTAITVSSGIDLIVSSINAPSSAVTGSSISVANTVNNNGTGTSATSYLKLYLSSDAVINPATDTYLTQRSIGALAGGTSSTASTTVKLPATLSPGTYYIGAIADATGTNLESNETNNTASTTAITFISGIDLIVSSINAPSSAVTGSSISVANTVNNNGIGTSATSYVKLYLSSDAVIDPATDTYLTHRSIGALAGGASSSASTTIKLPVTLSPGTYYIGAIADETNTNVESNETNNKAVSGAITLLSGVDLTVSSLSAPSSAVTGTSISVANTVNNNGTGTSSTSYVKLYLSSDTVIDPATDTYLTQRSIGALAGGTSSTASTTVKLPATLSPGTYYIGAIADATGTNLESNETNNTASTTAITFISGIDLIVSSISGPSSAVTGSSISVANTVNNNGTGTSATSYVNLYLSSDTIIDPGTDTYLTQRRISALAGGGSSSASTTISLPATLSPGTYYILAIADATSTNIESNEANNTGATAVLTVTSP